MLYLRMECAIVIRYNLSSRRLLFRTGSRQPPRPRLDSTRRVSARLCQLRQSDFNRFNADYAITLRSRSIRIHDDRVIAGMLEIALRIGRLIGGIRGAVGGIKRILRRYLATIIALFTHDRRITEARTRALRLSSRLENRIRGPEETRFALASCKFRVRVEPPLHLISYYENALLVVRLLGDRTSAPFRECKCTVAKAQRLFAYHSRCNVIRAIVIHRRASRRTSIIRRPLCDSTLLRPCAHIVGVYASPSRFFIAYRRNFTARLYAWKRRKRFCTRERSPRFSYEPFEAEFSLSPSLARSLARTLSIAGKQATLARASHPGEHILRRPKITFLPTPRIITSASVTANSHSHIYARAHSYAHTRECVGVCATTGTHATGTHECVMPADSDFHPRRESAPPTSSYRVRATSVSLLVATPFCRQMGFSRPHTRTRTRTLGSPRALVYDAARNRAR